MATSASPESAGNIEAIPIGTLSGRGGLSDGQVLTLQNGVTWAGRAPDNDVVLDDERVARQSAVARQVDNRLTC